MSDLSEEEIQALIGGELADTEESKPKADSDANDLASLDALVGAGTDTKQKVSRVEFAQLSGKEDGGGDTTNMRLLMDVPMQVSVELGRASRTVKEILSLNVGSVVELDKLSGEPVDLLVNGRTIAKAEVVVIDENFGIRITEILKAQDRIVLE